MEDRRDPRRNTTGRTPEDHRSERAMNSYMRDPWACYEDDERLCGDAEEEEAADCCCCW